MFGLPLVVLASAAAATVLYRAAGASSAPPTPSATALRARTSTEVGAVAPVGATAGRAAGALGVAMDELVAINRRGRIPLDGPWVSPDGAAVSVMLDLSETDVPLAAARSSDATAQRIAAKHGVRAGYELLEYGLWVFWFAAPGAPRASVAAVVAAPNY